MFSRVQARVLGILFGEPERDFSITEIISRADSGRGAVQRELEKLASSGIVSARIQGSRRFYHANKQSAIFTDLHQLVLKTVGVIEPIRIALAPYQPAIKSAFVYGSVAKGIDTAKSDIDLMILADDLSYADTFSALQAAETTLARPINPNLMSVEAWKSKANVRNSFIAKVLRQPKLFVFGTEDELRALR
ncbi:nucleotidyltransferase domain-containing protein [Dongia sp.]|uniref:nucleotidyltransferase domain-containing protein n=1 Tax=Dongia sp. TaxID=1977262 RepID=UPI0035B1077D